MGQSVGLPGGRGAGKGRGGQSQRVIFKEGRLKSCSRKRRTSGAGRLMLIAAQDFRFSEDNENGALLLEFLTGCTFQEGVLTSEIEILETPLFLIVETAGSYGGSRKEDSSRPGFISQFWAAGRRIAGPSGLRIGGSADRGLKVDSFKDLLCRMTELDERLSCPFSVFIHGDFNANNIIYDHKEQRLHYIDVYRPVSPTTSRMFPFFGVQPEAARCGPAHSTAHQRCWSGNMPASPGNSPGKR
jgi:hypothetical protein